jgi:hypothetical protein
MYPVLCAWCGDTIGECVVEHSHGICKECKARMLAEAQESMEAGQREHEEVKTG